MQRICERCGDTLIERGGGSATDRHPPARLPAEPTFFCPSCDAEQWQKEADYRRG